MKQQQHWEWKNKKENNKIGKEDLKENSIQFFSVRLRTSESENINKSSPPVSVENTPMVTTPNRPKKRDEEEKWTSVSSKKTSKASKVS